MPHPWSVFQTAFQKWDVLSSSQKARMISVGRGMADCEISPTAIASCSSAMNSTVATTGVIQPKDPRGMRLLTG
jgi:hypothetical protein